jgi:hypothetical protein
MSVRNKGQVARLPEAVSEGDGEDEADESEGRAGEGEGTVLEGVARLRDGRGQQHQ